MKKTCPYQILIAIINDQKVLEAVLLKTLAKYSIDKTIVSKAKGTAPSAVSDFFGFGTTEKNMLSTIIQSSDAEEVVAEVSAQMNKNKNNRGVVFTLPLTGMDSRMFQNLEVKNGKED